MPTDYASHCPLCGEELAEEAEPYDTLVECPECGNLDVEVWRPSE